MKICTTLVAVLTLAARGPVTSVELKSLTELQATNVSERLRRFAMRGYLDQVEPPRSHHAAVYRITQKGLDKLECLTRTAPPSKGAIYELLRAYGYAVAPPFARGPDRT